MSGLGPLVDELMRGAGDLWGLALIGQFFVMICESAKPKLEEGEERAAPRGFALLVMILSLFTPLLLFFHAFLTASGSLVAIVVALGGAIILATLIGWAIRATASPVARVLNSAAPVLALIVFALAVYISRDSVFALIRAMIEARAA